MVASNPSLPALGEFKQLLNDEIKSLTSDLAKNFLRSRLIEPYQRTIEWEYGDDEPYDCWVFADMGERNVVAMYCLGGFGSVGSPWDINFRDATHFGMDPGWYPSLGELLDEWVN